MAASGPVGVGFIGTGMISDTYLENLTSFPDVRLMILGDLDQQRAQAQAEKYNVPQWGSNDDVLTHPHVEIIVNLTIPAAHAEVASQAIAAGKHVWSEKPISVDRASGRVLLEQAESAGLLVGVAPDTVLGPGVQTARRAIANGDIGVPLSAQTVMQYPGPDIFHPNPEFLFAKGGGPLFDIGPYYITTLVHIFGPVATVAAVGSKGRASRTVRVGERLGTEFPVEVPTHVSCIAQFEDGGVSQSVFSFQSPLATLGMVEITGTEGTLIVPDPNAFTGEVKITRAVDLAAIGKDPEWELVPVTGALAGRGMGCWTWRDRFGQTRSTLHQVSSATTCSTPSCPSTKRSNLGAQSTSQARSGPSRSYRRNGTRSKPLSSLSSLGSSGTASWTTPESQWRPAASPRRWRAPSA